MSNTSIPKQLVGLPLKLQSLAHQWHISYRETGRYKRIETAFEISEGARDCGFTRDQVMSALQYVVNGDGKTATERFRLRNSFRKSDLKLAEPKKSSLSRSHFMILTRIESKEARQKLLKQAKDKSWSTKTLRTAIRGQSVVKVSARPTQLAMTIGANAVLLARDLKRLTAPEF